MSRYARNQKQGRCAFCGGLGLTKTHIFARSFTDLFPGHGVIRHTYEDPASGKRDVKRASTLAVVTRRFCASCNGGWMREAEEAVQPLLGAFARDRAVALGTVDQEQLAWWTTIAVFALLTKEKATAGFASSDIYREVYEKRTPLAGSQVWVGANNHGDVAWARSHSLSFDIAPDAHGFGASLSFGYGILHFVYHGLNDRELRLRRAPHRALKRIWPAQPRVHWPTALRVAATDLTGLAYEVNNNAAWYHAAA